MTDTLTPLGEMSFSAALAGPAAALAISLPKLQAELDALLAFTPTPPSISADIALAADILSKVSITVTPPDLSAQIAVVAGIIADLVPKINLVLGVVNMMATAGVHLYAYQGSTAGFGSTLSSALATGLPGGTGADACAGVALVATATAAVGVMPQLIKMS